MKKNEAYAYLRLVDFQCSVLEMTHRIGLQPTEAWHAGDPAPSPRPPHKFSAWHLRSRLSKSDVVEQHVIDMLDQIRGREIVIREIARDCKVTMECVGYFYEYYPGFALDADTVRRLGESGASIDLDFYHFFTDKNEVETHDHDA
jgi:hypothetical protein